MTTSLPSKKIKHDTDSNLKMRTLLSYDMLIRHLDIYTEEIFAKLDQSKFLVDYEPNTNDETNDENSKYYPRYLIESKVFNKLEENDKYIDRYKEEYELDETLKVSSVDPNKTKVHEYINKMRQEMVDELQKVQGEILKIIEKRKKENTDSTTNEKECFLLITKRVKSTYDKESSRCLPFQIYLFVLDDFQMDSKVKHYFK